MPTRAKSRESTQSDRVDNAAQTEPVDTEEEDESTAPLDAAVLHEINVVLRDHREDMMHLLREEAEQRERLVQLSSNLSMLQERFEVEVARLSEMNVAVQARLTAVERTTRKMNSKKTRELLNGVKQLTTVTERPQEAHTSAEKDVQVNDQTSDTASSVSYRAESLLSFLSDQHDDVQNLASHRYVDAGWKRR